MNDKQICHLVHATARQRAKAYIDMAPDGYTVTIEPPKRNGDQNSRFHAMVADVARQVPWAGKKRSTAEWKVLLVSGHAKATGEGFDIVPGLENEFVNLRESTAAMSKRRSSSLIEYTRAWGETHGVEWSERMAEPA